MRPNKQPCLSCRIRLEKLKQKTWRLSSSPGFWFFWQPCCSTASGKPRGAGCSITGVSQDEGCPVWFHSPCPC